MTLKNIHIIFINLSIVVTIGFGVWSIRYAQDTQKAGYLAAGVAAFMAAVGLLVYRFQFLKKANRLKL